MQVGGSPGPTLLRSDGFPPSGAPWGAAFTRTSYAAYVNVATSPRPIRSENRFRQPENRGSGFGLRTRRGDPYPHAALPACAAVFGTLRGWLQTVFGTNGTRRCRKCGTLADSTPLRCPAAGSFTQHARGSAHSIRTPLRSRPSGSHEKRVQASDSAWG